MKSLKETEDAIVDEFSMFDEWLDKYELLISLGKNLKSYPEDKKTDDKLIKGCQSRVWLDCEYKDGCVFMTADSDAIITKGIISLLVDLYSGRTPQEILSSDFSVVDRIGLRENLSPTRANGLVSMIERIREFSQTALRGQEVLL
ncbi:MAG: SufE family protein [Candidatus Cryptobacteroides sp.]